ncbi:MAG: UvrD-helicase domain-containing protein [Candidatus Dormibacteraeota bacterium]|nr:UvrD-helicase domain-containing protein [Candidatus Dormibacteraeota bacterium]MBO0759693.1 UvrD-helicase domain-containing protein [Candidatus Dormibacteraeota bacterium]
MDPEPDSLNEPQRAAVTHPAGPLLILAGAGSGKTRVLTMRIADLIGRRGAAPDRILALTFTNKAAREMRGRLRELLPRGAATGTQSAQAGTSPPSAQAAIWTGTFHAVATRILRRHPEAIGYRPGFAIFDEEDSRSLLKRALADLEVDPKEHQVAGLAARISRAKAELRGPHDLDGRGRAGQVLQAVYERYQQLARESNGMDFDDLLGNLALLLRSEGEAGAQWRSRFQHVLVDEFQDTNRAQYALLGLLTDPETRSLTVVGDDDQSIYAFRGADVRNVLDFQRDYPDAHVVKLEQNYRSTQAILDVAHHVIDKNRERMPKRLWTARGEGHKPILLLSGEDADEAAWVTDEILKLRRDAGWALADMAILFRTNAQSRVYERALVERRVPYHLVGGLRFWDRREVKDVVAYLRFLANPADAVSFDRIANVPRRRISDRTAQAAIGAASDGGTTILDVCGAPATVPVRADAQQALAAFHGQLAPLVAEAGRRPPSELVQLVLRYCNLADHYQDGSAGAGARLDNLEELRELARDYDHLAAPAGLERLLTDVALTTDADEVDGRRDQVTLITLHMVKGLEFPVVFLTGLEDKLLPHERAFEEPGGLEEERRLCYVGITRARRRLYLTTANQRTIFSRTVQLASSQFLHDVPGELLDLVAQEGHRAHSLAARVRRAAGRESA